MGCGASQISHDIAHNYDNNTRESAMRAASQALEHMAKAHVNAMHASPVMPVAPQRSLSAANAPRSTSQLPNRVPVTAPAQRNAEQEAVALIETFLPKNTPINGNAAGSNSNGMVEQASTMLAQLAQQHVSAAATNATRSTGSTSHTAANTSNTGNALNAPNEQILSMMNALGLSAGSNANNANLAQGMQSMANMLTNLQATDEFQQAKSAFLDPDGATKGTAIGDLVSWGKGLAAAVDIEDEKNYKAKQEALYRSGYATSHLLGSPCFQPSRSSEVVGCDSGRLGISLQFVLQLLKEVPLDWDTGDINKKIVQPRTEAFGKCRFVDIVPREHVGLDPPFFFSHTWAGHFHEQVDCLVSYANEAGIHPSDFFVWIDVFVLCQHALPGEEDDIAEKNALPMKMGVKGAKQTLVFMDHNALACSRIWCLFEIWTAFELHGAAGLSFVTQNDLTDMTRVFSKIDVGNASATKEADKEKIMRQIRASPLGVEGVNTQLREVVSKKSAELFRGC